MSDLKARCDELIRLRDAAETAIGEPLHPFTPEDFTDPCLYWQQKPAEFIAYAANHAPDLVRELLVECERRAQLRFLQLMASDAEISRLRGENQRYKALVHKLRHLAFYDQMDEALREFDADALEKEKQP